MTLSSLYSWVILSNHSYILIYKKKKKKKKKIAPPKPSEKTKQLKLLKRWRLGGLWFEVSPGKKFTRPHFNPCLGEVAHACHPALREEQVGGLQFTAAWA
jgi:hypothetical protein